MATGFISGATDLDSIFEPYSTGTKPGLTGYVTAGQDLRDRYAPLSAGSAAGVTGFKVGASDLNTLFAAIGSTAVVAINNYTNTTDATPPADSSTTYALNSDKSITGPGGVWLTGGTASDYEVRATQVSDTITGTGTSATGTLNTWMNLGTSRSWTVAATASSNTARRWVLTIEIRRASDLTVLDTATIDIEATTTLV